LHTHIACWTNYEASIFLLSGVYNTAPAFPFFGGRSGRSFSDK
jgi:hypothetical protein